MKHMVQKGKITIKKWDLGAKSTYLGLKNYEHSTNLERLNGAECK